ncbi:MAG: fibronectin type III domain-containing protein, partial [Yaniella sp.]|uniref:FN3 domain-containing metallophosphoesterase family protein n=1 Tax=Yaniella sp. TaxID=2773929 RepID=UPI00264A34B1
LLGLVASGTLLTAPLYSTLERPETTDELHFPTLEEHRNRHTIGPTSILLGIGAEPSERRLSWFTDTGAQESVQVVEGTHQTMPDSAVTVAPEEQAPSARPGHEYVHATLKNLSPGTYSYRVGSDRAGWSAIEQFEVYPDDVDHEFTFIGDAQIGASGDRELDAAGWQRALDANDELFPNSQFLLSAGDQVEADFTGNVNEYQMYVYPPQMRIHASAQTLGNHDYNLFTPQRLYQQHYNQPNLAEYDSTRGTYWFIYNDVLHLNVSTEHENWEEHREFLESTIAEHGADTQWTILTFHRALHGAATHSVGSNTTNDIRDGLRPAIHDLDIDLVLSGHDHSYARSYVIDSEGQQVDTETSEGHANGSVIVTPEAGDTLFIAANSSSGSKYYDLVDASSYQDGFEPRFRNQQYKPNITGIAVDQCSLTATTVELDGTTVDKVKLLRDC